MILPVWECKSKTKLPDYLIQKRGYLLTCQKIVEQAIFNLENHRKGSIAGVE